ncbi:mitochondrial substrate carrier family protein B-like isoform X1 [Salvia hispanica]|uniref:mitochondrial substrate carrier family protein B-like isoform X1 n=1 Tax=Salvia hispanica TaxID=49212 RepID=UPI002009A7C9|nr:mitochondrial substrate carrier family protein B-like isoform X1 [Salvia hispanica]
MSAIGKMQTEARVGVVVEGGGLSAPTTSSVVVEPPPRQRQIGTAPQLLAGGLAGAVSKTCTAPLARLTILFQVQGMHSDASRLEKASIWREASRIAREEGVRAFWKGNLVTIAHRLPYSSISFYAFERYKNMLQATLGVEGQGESIGADLCVRLLGGGLAGVTAASATYPLDLVRTRLTAQTNVIYYRGIFHSLRTISKEEGFRGLYKGLGPTLLGVGPNLAISFSVYDTARSYWQLHRPQDSIVLASLVCGSFSGIASSTVAYPLDLVRRRMQLEGAGGRALVYRTGLVGTLRQIIRKEGWLGLYRGILPEYYKVVPSVGIVFMTYEKLKQILSNIPES